MPTYNYFCHKCNSHFSYFQKMSDSPIKVCEECGGNIERIITGGTGIIFKGSGFYLTDYKDRKKNPDDVKKKNQNSTENSEKKINSKSTKIEKQTTPKKAEKTDE